MFLCFLFIIIILYKLSEALHVFECVNLRVNIIVGYCVGYYIYIYIFVIVKLCAVFFLVCGGIACGVFFFSSLR